MTTDAADDLSPVWSPDGSRLAFASRRKGLLNIYEMARDGGGEAKLAEDRQRNLYANAWSPDGRYVMYNLGSTGSSTASNDLWMVPVSGDRTPLPWLHTAFSENRAQFSPDGHWVAYTSNETGRGEVYVAAFPGPGGKVRISPAGGSHPRWRGDAKEIFFLTPANALSAATVALQAGHLQVDAVQPLLNVRLGRQGVPGWIGYMYDVSSDGQRFLVNVDTSGEVESSAISLVVNWRAGLARD